MGGSIRSPLIINSKGLKGQRNSARFQARWSFVPKTGSERDQLCKVFVLKLGDRKLKKNACRCLSLLELSPPQANEKSEKNYLVFSYRACNGAASSLQVGY